MFDGIEGRIRRSTYINAIEGFMPAIKNYTGAIVSSWKRDSNGVIWRRIGNVRQTSTPSGQIVEEVVAEWSSQGTINIPYFIE